MSRLKTVFRKITIVLAAVIFILITSVAAFVFFGPWQEYDGTNCAWDSCYQHPTVQWYNYWVDVAISRKNPFYCHFVIPRTSGDVAFMGRGKVVNACRLDYAQSTLDIAFCDRVKSSSPNDTNEEFRSYCYSHIALGADNIEICNQLKTRITSKNLPLEFCFERLGN